MANYSWSTKVYRSVQQNTGLLQILICWVGDLNLPYQEIVQHQDQIAKIVTYTVLDRYRMGFKHKFSNIWPVTGISKSSHTPVPFEKSLLDPIKYKSDTQKIGVE